MKQMYCESKQFYQQHHGKDIFIEWLNKTRHRQRMMIIVNEHLNRQQRLILRYLYENIDLI